MASDEITPATLEECLHQALALCPDSHDKKDLTTEALFTSQPLSARRLLPVSRGLATTPLAQARGSLLSFHQHLRALDPDVPCATVMLVAEEEWRIFRSDGTDVYFSTPRSLFRHELSLSAQGKNFTLATTWVGSDFSLLWDEASKDLVHRRVSNRLELLRQLPTAPPVSHGNYPLIIDAHLMGGLVHEAFGHAAESDTAFKGSILSDQGRFKTGLRVGPETLSIVDGPLDYDWGDQPFSASGFPRDTVAIVSQGVVRQALADVFSAAPIGVSPTGAERVEQYDQVPIPRMSNIRLVLSDTIPWEVDFEDVSAQGLYDFLLSQELVELEREYLYLSGYRGGQVNSTSGDFVFNCALIYRFKKGEVTLHQPAIFSGNIFAVLGAVQFGIGRLHVKRSGMCGKRGQRVPTSGGGPLFTLINSHPEIRIGGQ